jgi:transcriptional regulator with XRE-family HTH domain
MKTKKVEVIGMEIGDKIKEIREKNNLTQKQFGDKLNVTNSVVSRWESNTIKPDLTMLELISKTYDIDIMELIGNVGNKDNKGKDSNGSLKKCQITFMVSSSMLLLFPLFSLLFSYCYFNNYNTLISNIISVILIIFMPIAFIAIIVLYFYSIAEYTQVKNMSNNNSKKLKIAYIIYGILLIPLVITNVGLLFVFY